MDQIEKFIKRLDKKLAQLIATILADIVELKLKNYDVKKMKGYKDLFRIRTGNIRIIFKKTEKIGVVVYIDFRNKAYKKF